MFWILRRYFSSSIRALAWRGCCLSLGRISTWRWRRQLNWTKQRPLGVGAGEVAVCGRGAFWKSTEAWRMMTSRLASWTSACSLYGGLRRTSGLQWQDWTLHRPRSRWREPVGSARIFLLQDVFHFGFLSPCRASRFLDFIKIFACNVFGRLSDPSGGFFSRSRLIYTFLLLKWIQRWPV